MFLEHLPKHVDYQRFFFLFSRAAGYFDVGNRPKPRVTVTRKCERNVSPVRYIQSSSWLSNISLKLNNKCADSRKQTNSLPWIKHSKEFFIWIPNNLDFILNIRLCLIFFNSHVVSCMFFKTFFILIHCLPHCSVRYVTGRYTDPRWPGLCK